MNKHSLLALGFLGIILSINLVLSLTVSISPGSFSLTGEVGDGFSRSILVKNTNDVPVTVTLSTDAINIELLETEFELQPGESNYAGFTAEITELGTFNESIEVIFDSGTSKTNISSTVILTGTSYPESPEVEVNYSVSDETPDAVQGEEYIIIADITNIGDVETDYTVSIYGTNSWASLNSIENPEITLLPDETGTSIITININNDAIGEKEFFIRVSYLNKTSDITVPVVVQERGSTDIAYIVKNINSPNNYILSAINEMNYSYQLIDDSEISATDFTLYKMILVGNESITGAPVDSYRSLVLNPEYYSYFSSSKASTTKGNLYKKDNESIITEGLPDDFYSYTKGSIKLHYLTGKKYSTGVVTIGSSSTDLGNFVLAKKDSPRRVFYGAVEAQYWTSEARDLFKNSVSWIINGEDKDEDGYFSDVDCNDNDSLSWRNVSAYVDSDRDIYGGGNVLKICIGENLTSGYSYIGGDCNDTASAINPNTIERPYDGIDNNCDGYDLNDVDGDGYNYTIDCNDNNTVIFQNFLGYIDSDLDGYGVGELSEVCSGMYFPEGYSTIDGDCDDDNDEIFQIYDGYLDNDKDGFGAGELLEVCSGMYLSNNYSTIDDDCNDNNINVNPDAIELMDNINQNCVNDAPQLISNIENISWSEDEYYPGIIDLKTYFKDPDGDTLVFEVYNLSDNIIIEENNGILSFSSNLDWNGDATVVFSATDPDSESVLSNEISLKVNPEDDAPIIINLESFNVELDEDFGTYVYNLSDFKSDNDNNLSELTWNIDYITGDFNASVSGDELILNSIQDKNCIDGCEIMLKLSDKDNNFDREYFIVKINPVNDRPLLESNIPEISWNEDSELTDSVNLNDYFYDMDSDELTYSVTGNTLITININGSILSFSQPLDWYGEETIIVTAYDEEFNITSNEVLLKVNDKGEIPVFEEMECVTEIIEDTEYNCTLNASDFENDILNFEVVHEDNIECYINETTLYYQSYENFVGTGSCTIIVNDVDGYSEYVLNVNISNVNDAPIISSFSPNINKIKIMNNTQRIFSINTRDIDSNNLTIDWTINNESLGNLSSYVFNKDAGNYELYVTVSDGELTVSNFWEVFVGTISDFSCSEVDGYICSEDEICSGGELLDVFDGDSCCSVECSIKPPEFSNIKGKGLKSSDINVQIIDISDLEEFKTGEEIKFNTWVENNDVDNELDIELHAFLYDITREKVISDYEQKFEINANSLRTQQIILNVPKDIDEDDNFAIFVYAKSHEDELDYYNDDYALIKLERETEDIEIENVIIEQTNVVCGDYIKIKTKLKNYGETDERVYIQIESALLKINEETSEFLLNAYNGEDNVLTKEFYIKLPDSLEIKEYSINVKAVYNDGNIVETKTVNINVEDCKKQESDVTPVISETIALENTPIIQNVEKKDNTKKYIVAGISLVLSLVIVILMFIAIKMHSEMPITEVVKKTGKSVKKKKK